MVALEIAIELPNGHANGYRHAAAGAEGVVLQDVESLITPPELQKARDDPISAAAESVPNVSPQGQPTTTAADKAKPSQAKAASPTGRKTGNATAAKKAKQNKKAKSAQPKLRYVPQAKLDAEQAKLEKLSRAALAGDTEALDELRSELDKFPHLWRRLADLQERAEVKMIELVAGKDPLRAESFRKRASELRHGLLEGQWSSLATKLAAGRLVMSLMFVELLELRFLETPDELRNIKALEQAQRRNYVAMRALTMAKQSELQFQQLAQPINQGG